MENTKIIPVDLAGAGFKRGFVHCRRVRKLNSQRMRNVPLFKKKTIFADHKQSLEDKKER